MIDYTSHPCSIHPRTDTGIVMNRDQIAGNWKQIKDVVRKKWSKLTDDDLDVLAGNHRPLTFNEVNNGNKQLGS